LIYVVDTHALVWFLEKSDRLGKAARAALTSPGNYFLIPTIVLAEIRYLAAARRISPDFDAVLKVIREDGRFMQIELDQTIVELMPLQLDIHDGIVVATALDRKEILLEDCAVITKDRAIVASGLVETVW
jgi:PIN domain nuclease of toxin-antitoxin system